MAGSSGAGPREVGPSGEKQKKPRRARFHALASVGAVMVAIAAIAATTWALSRGDGGDGGPDAHEATSETGTPSTELEWNTGAPTPSPTEPPFSMPTFPTPTPTDDTTTTSPFSFPTPSATTPPLVASPTNTYPYTPPATTPSITSPTTTAPTTQPPSPIAVRPAAPTATPIKRCGQWGSLEINKTTGVRYDRTVGNGREGRWVVRAYARNGYVIASGAKTRWEGNLGNHRPCPGDPTIDEVTKVSTGDPDPGAWDLTVDTTVPGTRDRELALTFVFTTEARVIGSAGEGWSCQDVEDPVAAGTPIACTYTGDAPPDVTLSVVALDGDQAVEPQGTLELTTDGKVTDDASF